MLVSSTQRPLGLSVEELYALDRQYRRIEQQQQQSSAHFGQLSSQTRPHSSNLNRLNSRSLDLISSTTPLPVLPSLEIHGHGYSNRPQTSSRNTLLHYPRSNSIDQLRYTPPVLTSPSHPTTIKSTYPSRPTINESSNYHSRYRNYLQHPTTTTTPSMATGPSTSAALANNFIYHMPSSNDSYESRNACKLRRQQPLKRESSRRIVVRPVVQRRREPSISSSCESLDEPRSPMQALPIEQLNFIASVSVPVAPPSSVINHHTESVDGSTARHARSGSNNDSLSDDSDVNLYEMRVPIGKTYDTSDISVQLEGPKILIHCHTIEPTDKRGNYRKHEFKTELLVPDIVDDETIVSYLTEDGQLIVEGKYHEWVWKEMKQKRKAELQQQQQQQSVDSATPVSNSSTTSVPTRNESARENEKISRPLSSNSSAKLPFPSSSSTSSRIEKLDNNRTVIHVGEPTTDSTSVTEIINRFNTFNPIWDGQYSLSNDIPPLLLYHVRLPPEATMDSVRIQSDPQSNILKVFSEPSHQSTTEKTSTRTSMPRICRLPRDYHYDYAHLHVIFLRDNFIRIEVPLLN